MSKPIASARITKKYQASIPKAVREVINADVGDLLLFFRRENEVFIHTTVPPAQKPGVEYQLIQELSPITEIYHNQGNPSLLLLWQWKTSDKEDGWGIEMELGQINQIISGLK